MERPADPKKFLSEEEKRLIDGAIDKAEKETSGEIKLFIGRFCWGSIEDKAGRVFRKLGLSKTKERNGVLIYLVTANREFLIYGDEGINSKVPADFWDGIKDRMEENFSRGDFGKGLAEAIETIGVQLKAYFPCRKDDRNELSDDIEYGEE
ncbi:MAG: TPM domain-containing protein [Candidatus Omnitrophica bacterium]|nr:TPM domain-containing protein [Candidatus Omnitrophota bacterium]